MFKCRQSYLQEHIRRFSANFTPFWGPLWAISYFRQTSSASRAVLLLPDHLRPVAVALKVRQDRHVYRDDQGLRPRSVGPAREIPAPASSPVSVCRQKALLPLGLSCLSRVGPDGPGSLAFTYLYERAGPDGPRVRRKSPNGRNGDAGEAFGPAPVLSLFLKIPTL